MKNDVFVIGSNDTSESEPIRIETFNFDDNAWSERKWFYKKTPAGVTMRQCTSGKLVLFTYGMWPTPLFKHFRFYGYSTVNLEKSILLIGGVICGNANTIIKFETQKDNPTILVSNIGTLLFPRWGHRAMINDGRVFIIGGMNEFGTNLWVFQTATIIIMPHNLCQHPVVDSLKLIWDEFIDLKYKVDRKTTVMVTLPA